MKVLVDTDGFCKLAVAGLLEDAVRLLGATLDDCGRLPALPRMLRRGGLRRAYGGETCDRLLPVAESIGTILIPSSTWLDGLAGIEGIDPGEAQILAAAAERELLVLSGDKRALRSVKNLSTFVSALGGRIVTIEAALIALCDTMGPDAIRLKVPPMLAHDTAVRLSFAESSRDPLPGLRSYFESLCAEVTPLNLWTPPPASSPK